ncbi:MAG: hypothetical protein F2696_03220 [Actinobacteria bacterium]|uniref:Unannotated protein n=1 Tax=freshwater metagenome TaxID=449393 RepID=A0A6J6SM86_9ZZZZ|nr:hypothetical protein [Actinomycetota bacterium]
MLTIVNQLRLALLELFTTTKYRIILISLVLIAAFISVSELAVAKLFTNIILHEGTLSQTKLILFVGAFFLFFGGTRAGHFLQRIYRVNVFDKAFKASNTETTGAKENWRWSLAFELTNLLSTFTQLGVIVLFFTYFNWIFGLINIAILLLVFEVYGRLFKHQMEAQRGFVVARKNKTPIANVVRIGTRIKSGETGILLSGVAMIILLAALIYLSYNGDITKANTVVLFFGLRMQNSNLSNISTGLMRFARARTHSE